jgi:hypothetical protein
MIDIIGNLSTYRNTNCQEAQFPIVSNASLCANVGDIKALLKRLENSMTYRLKPVGCFGLGKPGKAKAI